MTTQVRSLTKAGEKELKKTRAKRGYNEYERAEEIIDMGFSYSTHPRKLTDHEIEQFGKARGNDYEYRANRVGGVINFGAIKEKVREFIIWCVRPLKEYENQRNS